MLRAIAAVLFKSTPLELYSPLPASEALQRLRNATDSSFFGPLAGQAMTGTVSEEQVRLERSIAFVQNSFKPVFIGRVEAHASGSVLRGRLGLPWPVRAFMTFWFGFCALWTALAAFAVFANPKSWFVPFFGVGMVLAGIGIVRLGQWLARNDRQYLENAISKALAQSAA